MSAAAAGRLRRRAQGRDVQNYDVRSASEISNNSDPFPRILPT